MGEAEKIGQGLTRLAQNSPPKLRELAAWVLDNLPQVAFGSIRGLAVQAGSNPNTVIRLARELGFDGFEGFKAAVQAQLQAGANYSSRAAALHNRSGAELRADLVAASRENFEALFHPDTMAVLESCVDPLLSARRVHSVGVRSCFGVAYYFSYAGRMAFDNFVEVPSVPGAILDQMSRTGPEDIVVIITYAHYSQEAIRACQVARSRGARVLALTDSFSAPVALDAWQVLRLPMAGPQLMPSLAAAFVAVEMLLAEMAARSETAADRTAAFEARLRDYGGYI
ncbi:MurR/RpiR family transcriptional regulator [Mesobacterium sp. TK19101]|uniref:MurR/RpiR family transcriptional regulator n=1 Tax=Mesobacterium hydrothermale TaxID=3111907 RepID=A0ABU6HGX1_9RHOB|nr:MurR/RpiR family transcriptional regulator [Mesobacterium sp. TK19101]MEC3861704.1 MurR/RpiR family transcriptional regulator [Mesobacterium sp. TK19101]